MTTRSRRRRGSIGMQAAAVLAALGAGWLVASPAAYGAVPVKSSATIAGPPSELLAGQSQQLGPDLEVSISNDFTTGDTITIPIEVGSSPTANTGAADQAVGFSGPARAAGSAPSGDTAPTVSVSLTTDPADSAAVKSAGIEDEMVITFTDSASGSPTDMVNFDIGTLYYSVGSAAGTQGVADPVQLDPTYTSNGISEPISNASGASQPLIDGYVYQYTVSQVPVGVATGSSTAALSAYIFDEGAPGLLQTGTFVLKASQQASGAAVDFTGTVELYAAGLTIAAANLSAGNCPTTGTSSLAVSAANGEYAFCVASSSDSGTGPGKLAVTGMTVDVPTSAGALNVVLASVTSPSGRQVSLPGSQPALTAVFNPRVAGDTADDTAAVSAVSLYSGQVMNGGDGGAVILASDAEYQDALAASFLGEVPLPYQNTSGGTSSMSTPVPILLNPPSPPSGGEAQSAAVAAIGDLGASTVYIIGGTSAISTSVAEQLAGTQIGYFSNGNPMYLQVGRIAGDTAEETAADVAELATSADITLPATPGAYGRYNSGASESASGPSSGQVPTVILADASEFQDALAASPLAYGATVPVLLNPPGPTLDPNTSAAITKLGATQVIVVGGSAAVSDQVVSTLIAKGLSVLRIAGYSYEQTAEQLALFELDDYTPPGSGAQVVDGLDSQARVGSGGPTITVGTSRGDAFPDALSSAQILGGASSYMSPLLLAAGTDSLSAPTAAFLSAYGTGPNGGLTVYDDDHGDTVTEHILGDVVFGGTDAQTPGLVQTELDDIAAG